MTRPATEQQLRNRAEQARLYGAPLGDLQFTQGALAEMATAVDASALLVYRAAWTKDAGAERVTAEAAAGSAVGLLGTVNWYEPAKGYGFASPDGGGPDIFVHSSAIVTGGVVSDGQRVAFLV